ncbi:hypothetical protein Tco_1265192 [Tanacetum coccineum]|uniref:Uncharacterized protein n=1 Tax=Tanacetum coccineum TaxID=301880 RepID=A0ABQ5BBW7_9ASTR
MSLIGLRGQLGSLSLMGKSRVDLGIMHWFNCLCVWSNGNHCVNPADFIMAELPTERVALDEYMGFWFRGEVLDMVKFRSMIVRCRTEVQGILKRRRVLHHLENVKGCPTSG